jgi:hypothetical protein
MAVTIIAKHGMAAGMTERISLQNKWRTNLAELMRVLTKQTSLVSRE